MKREEKLSLILLPKENSTLTIHIFSKHIHMYVSMYMHACLYVYTCMLCVYACMYTPLLKRKNGVGLFYD